MESDAGGGHIPWPEIHALRIRSDFWMLYFNEEDFTTLPANLLSSDLQEFIIKKVSEAGGKVIR